MLEVNLFSPSDVYDSTGSPTLVLTRPATDPSARSGSRLPASALAQSSTRSNGRASAAQVGEAAGHAQLSAVPATACCTATDRMLHHRLAHPDMAARLTAGRARYARACTRPRTRPRAPASFSCQAEPLLLSCDRKPASNVRPPGAQGRGSCHARKHWPPHFLTDPGGQRPAIGTPLAPRTSAPAQVLAALQAHAQRPSTLFFGIHVFAWAGPSQTQRKRIIGLSRGGNDPARNRALQNG